jgi:hypothetical protein
MTVPNWGRITPTQGDMLMVAGHVLRPYRFVPPGTAEQDQDRLAAMKTGRERLRRRTGHDCGYDLARWHELLLGSEGDEWGYRHPYAWSAVRLAIEQAIADPDRIRLIELLNQEG